jgi:hypothetical protein
LYIFHLENICLKSVGITSNMSSEVAEVVSEKNQVWNYEREISCCKLIGNRPNGFKSWFQFFGWRMPVNDNPTKSIAVAVAQFQIFLWLEFLKLLDQIPIVCLFYFQRS